VAAVSDVYPQEQLGYRIGLLQTAGGGLGLLGPVLGGVLISLVGISATFAIACALPAAFIVAALRMPETSSGEGEPPRLLPSLRRLAAERKARAGAIALASAASILALLEPLLPLDLTARHDLGAAAVGAVFAAGLLAFFVGAPLAGGWSDRHGRRPPILVGGVVVAVTLPLTAIGPPALVAASFFALGLGLATLAAPAGPLLTAAVDDAGMTRRYGLSAAILTAIFATGYSLGPLLGAAASAVMPFTTIVVIAGVLVLVASVLAGRILGGGPDPVSRR
jgi:MFS family permease